MGVTPLFNIHITAGSTRQLSKTRDLGANDYLEVTGMSFLTAWNLWMEEGGTNQWGDVDAGPYFLEVCRDSAAVVAGTQDPLFWHLVTNSSSSLANQVSLSTLNFRSLMQPLVGDTFQFHIRRGDCWPNGTVGANADWDNATLELVGYPPRLS